MWQLAKALRKVWKGNASMIRQSLTRSSKTQRSSRSKYHIIARISGGSKKSTTADWVRGEGYNILTLSCGEKSTRNLEERCRQSGFVFLWRWQSRGQGVGVTYDGGSTGMTSIMRTFPHALVNKHANINPHFNVNTITTSPQNPRSQHHFRNQGGSPALKEVWLCSRSLATVVRWTKVILLSFAVARCEQALQ